MTKYPVLVTFCTFLQLRHKEKSLTHLIPKKAHPTKILETHLFQIGQAADVESVLAAQGGRAQLVEDLVGVL